MAGFVSTFCGPSSQKANTTHSRGGRSGSDGLQQNQSTASSRTRIQSSPSAFSPVHQNSTGCVSLEPSPRAHPMRVQTPSTRVSEPPDITGTLGFASPAAARITSASPLLRRRSAALVHAATAASTAASAAAAAAQAALTAYDEEDDDGSMAFNPIDHVPQAPNQSASAQGLSRLR